MDQKDHLYYNHDSKEYILKIKIIFLCQIMRPWLCIYKCVARNNGDEQEWERKK